jgi:hypothetical protein
MRGFNKLFLANRTRMILGSQKFLILEQGYAISTSLCVNLSTVGTSVNPAVSHPRVGGAGVDSAVVAILGWIF